MSEGLVILSWRSVLPMMLCRVSESRLHATTPLIKLHTSRGIIFVNTSKLEANYQVVFVSPTVTNNPQGCYIRRGRRSSGTGAEAISLERWRMVRAVKASDLKACIV